MTDGLGYTPGAGATVDTENVSRGHLQRFKLAAGGVDADNTDAILPTSLAIHSASTVTGSGSQVVTAVGAAAVHLEINVKANPTGTLTPTLTYTIAEVDPVDQTTVVGSTVTGAGITAIGVLTVSLAQVKSSCIKVSWALTGSSPSFTLVNATLVAQEAPQTQPVSGSVTANIGTSGSLALDATLTGGTTKAIARGGAKGSTAAADLTSTAEGANHQALDVQIYNGGSALDPTAIRALTAADIVTVQQGSLPAGLSAAWPFYIADTLVGPAAVKSASTAAVAGDKALVVTQSPNLPSAIPTGGGGNAALPVTMAGGRRRATYVVTTGAQVTTGTMVASTRVQILSFEHLVSATKTLRLLWVEVSGDIITAGGAVVSYFGFQFSRGTAASSAGTALGTSAISGATGAAEVTCKSLPTIAVTAAFDPIPVIFAPAAGLAAGSTFVRQRIYDATGQTADLEQYLLRAGVAENFVINAISDSTPAAHVIASACFIEE